MKRHCIAILCLITVSKAVSGHEPAGGARGKTVGAGSNAAEFAGAERIMGGNETSPHEFPFHALLVKYGNMTQCGAVIIDTEWALTAGHCAGPGATDLFTIWAGKHIQTIPESTEQIVNVILVVKHEKYGNTPLQNDITALKVSPPFQFNEYVQKVALPKRSDEKYSTGRATTVGWGTSETSNGFNTTTLRKVSLPLMTNARCQELFEILSPGSILPGNICAGGEPGNKSACFGDSGGPLLFIEDGKQVLIGTTSWGINCGLNDTPTVFTRITEFKDWIGNTTGLDLSGTGYRQVSDGDTSGGPAKSDEVRAKISNGLAQTMCKGFGDYQNGKKMPPAVKVRPRIPEKCGWAQWSGCRHEGSCKPFTFVRCKG